jgi:HEAT repeat protein
MLGDPRAVEPLITLMQEPALHLRSSARSRIIKALGELGDRRAVEPLLRLLQEPGWELSTPEKRAAITVLGDFGDARAIDLLNSLLDKEEYNCIWVIEALSKIADQRALDTLQQVKQKYSAGSPISGQLGRAIAELSRRLNQEQ